MKPAAEVPYFPRWTLRTEGVIAPDERLPAGPTLALGLQHVVAMFGATVLAPLLMGFDPNVAILFSGIGSNVGRCRTLPSVLVNSRFVTGSGATRLTGPTN